PSSSKTGWTLEPLVRSGRLRSRGRPVLQGPIGSTVAATLPASPYKDDPKMERSDPQGRPPAVRRTSPWADTGFAMLAHGAARPTLALLLGILVSLFLGAGPAIKEYGLSFLWRSDWDPVQNQYGGLVVIYGTLATSAIALIIAVPVSFGIALF